MKKREDENMHKLAQMVGKLHGVPKNENGNYMLPTSWYHQIQDLRNGTERYSSNFKKKYKQGFSFTVIAEAYRISVKGINRAKKKISFESINQELNYGVAVVRNNIPDAMKRLQARKQQDAVNKVKEKEFIENIETEREVAYQKKKAVYDLSDFLD